MKKILALLLVLLLLTSTFAACGEKEKTPKTDTKQDSTQPVDDPMGKYDPPITVTTVVSLNDEMQQMIGVKEDVLTNNNWINGYRDELGIEVEYLWSVPGAQYEQKMNTQIAANDLPDVFNVSMVQLKMLVDSGMVADMTSYFEEYQTDFTREMFDADNGVGLSQSTYDDKLMALPNLSGNMDGASVMWIRQDWLDSLGLEVPTTMEELYEIARAFTEDDPDGNGQDDTHGIALNKDVYAGGLNDATGIFEGFRAYPNGWIERDDSLVNGIVQPEIKEGLAYLADLYSKGYIDKEFSAKDNSKVSEDIVGGKVGISFGQHWAAFWPFQDSINANPEADWVPYPIPTADGKMGTPMIHGSAGIFAATNVDAEHPEASVKLLNYYYKKDCALSPDYDSKFHVTSTLLMERPEEAFQWAIVKSFYPQQNLFIQEGVKKYMDGDESVLENPWVEDNALQCQDYIDDPVANQQFWSAWRWSGPQGAFAAVREYLDGDGFVQNAYVLSNTEGMTQYSASLGQIAIEAFTKIIMGAESVDSYDDFVAQWKSLGGDEITEEVNELMA